VNQIGLPPFFFPLPEEYYFIAAFGFLTAAAVVIPAQDTTPPI